MSAGGGCLGMLVPNTAKTGVFWRGVTKILEVTGVVGQSLKVLVFTLKSHTPQMFQWAKL